MFPVFFAYKTVCSSVRFELHTLFMWRQLQYEFQCTIAFHVISDEHSSPHQKSPQHCCSWLQEGLSEYSTLNQSSFMPLLPGPCASGQEAGVRMAYIPKVSFKSKWQAAGKYHGCCQPRLCHAVCRYKHRSFFMPGMILSSCSWLLLCYKHDLTNKFLGTCVMPSWEMCGTCLDAVKASSRKMKATWKLPAIRGCRLQQSPWAWMQLLIQVDTTVWYFAPDTVCADTGAARHANTCQLILKHRPLTTLQPWQLPQVWQLWCSTFQQCIQLCSVSHASPCAYNR